MAASLSTTCALGEVTGKAYVHYTYDREKCEALSAYYQMLSRSNKIAQLRKPGHWAVCTDMQTGEEARLGRVSTDVQGFLLFRSCAGLQGGWMKCLDGLRCVRVGWPYGFRRSRKRLYLPDAIQHLPLQ
jgi:hypothetical protein